MEEIRSPARGAAGGSRKASGTRNSEEIMQSARTGLSFTRCGSLGRANPERRRHPVPDLRHRAEADTGRDRADDVGRARIPFECCFARGLGILLLVCTALYAYPRTSILGRDPADRLSWRRRRNASARGSPVFSHLLFGVYLGLMLWGGLFLRDHAAALARAVAKLAFAPFASLADGAENPAVDVEPAVSCSSCSRDRIGSEYLEQRQCVS